MVLTGRARLYAHEFCTYCRGHNVFRRAEVSAELNLGAPGSGTRDLGAGV